MIDPKHALTSLPKRHDYFIGIDSDGTAFDTMGIKQKCFCRSFIQRFGFHGQDAEFAKEVWEFVNLHSITRGCNRFLTLMRTLDLLAERGVKVPDTPHLRQWIAEEHRLGNPALKALLEKTPSAELENLYAWSTETNQDIAGIVHDIPPFPNVRDALARASRHADIVVVSQTPFEALSREWREHGINGFVQFIAGQECGTKTEHIRFAAGGKYEPEKILMIGDSTGDLDAAKANHALFFPVLPGQEAESWKEFAGHGLDRFFDGTFAGEYQDRLLTQFLFALPAAPPWRISRCSLPQEKKDSQKPT